MTWAHSGGFKPRLRIRTPTNGVSFTAAECRLSAVGYANPQVLAGIVLIRTFLSFSLEVELEGRWPWRSRKPTTPAAADR
ncbi:hypothetical protein [Streptomonospora mangrovi]